MKRYRVSFGSKIIAPEPGTMSKELKSYLNLFRCPVCRGQLEGAGIDKINLYCVNLHDEYRCTLINTSFPPSFLNESVTVFNDKFRYFLTQNYNAGQITCSIYIDRVDKEGRIIDGTKQKVLVFHSKLFDFQALDKARILSKIKTILVFQ